MQTMPMAKSETAHRDHKRNARTNDLLLIFIRTPQTTQIYQQKITQDQTTQLTTWVAFHDKETFHLVMRWKGVQKSCYFLCFTNWLLKINKAPQQRRHFVTVCTWYFYCTCFSFTFYLSLQFSSNIFHVAGSEAALGELRLGQLIQV